MKFYKLEDQVIISDKTLTVGTELVANTVDAAQEKHVGVFSATVPVLGIVLHLVEIQHSHNICGAEASSRMPALCHCHHPEDVSADLTGNIFQSLDI